MTLRVHQWRMRRRTAELSLADFELAEAALDPPRDGEVRTRTLYISLDPYLARAMQTWQGEVPGWADGVIHGRVISEVVESRASGFSPGDMVLGVGRWQAQDVFPASALEKVADDIDPPSLAVGVLGRSGLTAWVGVRLAKLQPGQTLLVSAASGPVGSVAGQLAKQMGCRVVGSAGGADKCAYVEKELGFDACVDHRRPDYAAALAAAAAGPVHAVFENIGAQHIDAALPLMVNHGRIALCGLASHYNNDAPVCLQNFRMLLWKQITLQAFATADYRDQFEQGLADLKAAVRSGALRWSETVIDGLENAAEAYLGMLQGQGLGKRVVRVAGAA